jgi:hypothetical protein
MRDVSIDAEFNPAIVDFSWVKNLFQELLGLELVFLYGKIGSSDSDDVSELAKQQVKVFTRTFNDIKLTVLGLIFDN